jgi:site-specific DNA-methyltransferase (adenine-specific)
MLKNSGYNPDVLSCLANLSSDEVFTPPQLANQILDMLPEDIWSDKNARFLDPFCKSGVFLREIAKRLNVGLEKEMPNQQKRINHILKNQVFGIAITEMTALLSRRSLYCSKKANGKYSVCDSFDDLQGNVCFKRIEHTWRGIECAFCGANKEGYDRGSELETHAYQFIHTEKPEEIFNMKFDVIIGNPPYQLDTGGVGRQATPIYPLFVQQAKKLNPRFLSMIIPARWFAGGMALDEFRTEMLNDQKIRNLVDYPIASDVFPGVKVIGGICYFLWERDYKGMCSVTTKMGDAQDTMMRELNQFDTFVRFNKAISILKKVLIKKLPKMSSQVSGAQPFGLPTTVRPTGRGTIKLYANKCKGNIERNAINSGEDMISRWKVFISLGYGEGGEAREYPRMIMGKPIVAAPPSACTMTYLVAGHYGTEIEANNLATYLRTKFFRFLVGLRKNTQHLTKDRFAFAPILPMNKKWTDKKLYEYFKLTVDEITFIESMIRPMEGNDE